MTPQTQDNYVGIEIECFTQTYMHDQVVEVVEDMDLTSYVEVGEDGSIRPHCNMNNDAECSCSERALDLFGCECDANDNLEATTIEFRILCKQKELHIVLPRVGKLLETIEAQVNESCGLHVHLDMRNRQPHKCFNKLLNMQGVMLKTIPKSRRMNTYCLPINKKDDIYSQGKYRTINYNEAYNQHKTIEVRLHEGTVDVLEIKRWALFLISVIDNTFSNVVINTNRKQLPVRVRNYLARRIACNNS